MVSFAWQIIDTFFFWGGGGWKIDPSLEVVVIFLKLENLFFPMDEPSLKIFLKFYPITFCPEIAQNAVEFLVGITSW